MDPFGLTREAGPEEMPLLIARDTYDFVSKIKKFYYSEESWTEYSTHGMAHVTKWFKKESSAHDLDDCMEYILK